MESSGTRWRGRRGARERDGNPHMEYAEPYPTAPLDSTLFFFSFPSVPSQLPQTSAPLLPRPASNIPDLHRPILPCGEERLSVPGKKHSANHSCVPRKNMCLFVLATSHKLMLPSYPPTARTRSSGETHVELASTSMSFSAVESCRKSHNATAPHWPAGKPVYAAASVLPEGKNVILPIVPA